MNLQMTKLGEICEFINGDRGKNYPSGNDIVKEGVPFINAGHIQNNKINLEEMNYITEEKYNLLGSGKIKKGDIVYCLRGSLGKYGIISLEKGAIASSLVILRPNKCIVEPRFLMHYLGSTYIQKQIYKANNGSSQPNLSAQSVKNFDIYLPCLNIQIKIANILDQAQELIDKRKAQIKALDELIQSVFYDMFGDPLINEEEWPRKCINEVVDYLKRGKSPKYVDYSNIRVINQKCIYWRKFIDSNCKYYNEDFEDKIKDQYLQDKDILINSTGTGTLGRAVVVNVKEDDKFVVDSHVTLMRVNLYCINPIFIATLFEFNNIQSEIYLKCVNGSTNQIELSVVKLGDYQVIIPPIELQNQFAEIVARIQKQKELLNESLVELENNFNSLMQRAFSGGSLR